MKKVKIKISIWRNAYPYFICAMGALFIFYKYLLQISPSVMVQDLMRTFSMSGAGLGNLAACFLYTYLIMQIPAGIILDRFNPYRITIITLLLCASSVILFANANTLLVAEFSRALMGLTAAFSGILYLKLVAIWLPPKRFALMTGLMMTVAMLGAIGGQAPLSFMVVSLGWRGAMMFIGLIGFILVFLFTGAMLYKQTPFFSDSSATTSNKLIKDLFLFIKNKRNWLLSLYTGFAFAPFSAFAGLWGISFLQQAYHLPKTLAASATSFIFIGFAIGCPLLGWISDYLGRRLPIMFVATVIALLSLCVVIYLPVKSTILLSFLLFNFGFWVSSLMLSFTIAREAQNTLLIASIMGFMNTIPSLFEAFTAPLIGKMLDMGWNHQLLHGARVFSVSDYRLGLSLLPAYLIIALLLLAFITESKRKNSKLIAQNSYKTAKYFYIKP